MFLNKMSQIVAVLVMPKKVPDIEKRIIEYLKKVEWPSTAEDVAKAIGVELANCPNKLIKVGSSRNSEV